MKDFLFESRYLDPLTDFGFHKIFGTESCKELLIDFLNGIIKEEGLITDIQYLQAEQWGNTENDRKAIFDIFCINERGEFFIVEMQKAKQPHFQERSIYYASFPIQRQAPQGIWNFELKAVYLVAVLDFVLFKEFIDDEKSVIERVHLYRERTKTPFSNKLNFVFVELPKFRKNEEDLVTNVDKWLYSLKNLSKLRNRPASVQGRIFEKLFKFAEIKQLTQEDMEAYRKSVLEYQDIRDAIDYAREEALEEGIERGIENEKIATLKKCIQLNLSTDVIVSLTGFSEEEIKQLRVEK